MSKNTRQLLTFVMALVMMFSCFVTPAAAASAYDKAGTRIEPLTQSVNLAASSSEGEVVAIDGEEPVEIMVRLDSATAYLTSGDLQAAADQAPALLQAQAQAEQKIETALAAEIDVTANFTVLFNGFSFIGYEWMVHEINQLGGMTAFVSPVFTLVEPETEVTPSMGTSTGMVSATDAWELGYTGKGTVVAVIDTGILSTHEAFSVMPQGAKIDKEYLANVYAQYGSLMHSGSDVDSLYYNEKMPFNYDYFDYDYIPNHTASDHGTHVAGIAAGNNGVDFKGVAPDAQIVTMQVFTDTGGASFSTLIQAMEDCVYLGVDSINMSLGVANGWSDYTSVGLSNLEEVYNALENAGVSVAVAAGNDGTTLTWTNYGDYYYSVYQGLSSNYDIGTVGAPATLPGSFGVASVVNTDTSNGGYITVNGQDYYPLASVLAPETPTMAQLPAGEYELVYAGNATEEELAAANVAGKFVIAQRDAGSFTDKCTRAAAAGAVAIVVYNNVPGSVLTGATSSIPMGTLSLEDGEKIVAGLTDGKGTVTVVHEFAYGGVAMADSSSWGATSDLRIVPDIAAPGDGITSSIGFGDDASYSTWSGTSMATPHVAAGLNIIKERLREEFPGASPAEINELAYTFAMSTAHEVNGFVRQQGAGIIDVAAALTTDVYLSVEDNARPKLELDESEDGTWTFTVTLNNIGDADHTYTVDVSAMTHNVFDYDYSGNGWKIQQETTTVKLINTAVKDVTDMVEVDAPETVTVAAGTSETIEVTIACTGELLAWFEENCPSGMYLEGFVTFNEAEGIDLSVPYLGFVGDFDYASILDRGYYWQNATGELTYQQMYTSISNKVGFGHDQLLGLNPYADMTGKTYLTDRNAISPNGDGLLDLVNYIEFTLLRNPNTVKIYIESTEGELLETLYDADYAFSKDFYAAGLNGGDSFKYVNLAFDMAAYAENETVNLVFETWLDHEGYDPADNESGRWIIPVTKDTVAPSVAVTDTGIEVVDDNYVAYVAVYADEAKTQLLAEEAVYAEERGVAANVAVEADTYYVTVADYAGNEQMYVVSGGVAATTDAEAFFHGRTVIGQMSKDYATLEYNFEWVSFRADLPGGVTMLTDNVGSNVPADLWAEGIDIQYLSTSVNKDGVLYANTLFGIYELDPETFEGTEVVGRQESVSFRNISIRPGTNDMYAWCYGYINDTWDNWFCKIDLENGTYTPIFCFPSSEYEISVWAMTFKSADEILIFDSWHNRMATLNLNGEVLDIRSPEGFQNSWGESDLGIFGYAGNLLYDAVSNTSYMFSDWTWFINNHYSWAGCVRYDFNTDEADLLVMGNAPGLVVTGTFFEDSIIPEVKIPLTDFALSEETLELSAGSSAKVDVIKTPEDANWYNLTWSVDDESVATIKGNRKNVTINAINPGTTTVTATATDRDTGELITVKTIEVTVVLDAELQAALNVAGGKLEFISYAPYPFVPTTDEATGREYAVSSNAGIANSESRLVMTEELHMGDTIAFDYFVSSEVDFDYLYFYVNGELVFADSGESGWTEYEFMAPWNGEYTLEWVYVKDPAVEEGTDNAGVDNVRLIPGEFCAANIFSDVDAGRYYHDAVDFMVGYGYTNGMSATTFGTNADLTRGQLVTILYRMAGEPSVVDMVNPFTDLKVGSFYYDAVVWAANMGIVKGITETTFAPNDAVTRQQLATILYRMEGEPEVDPTVLAGYVDADDVSRFAWSAMAWAVSNDIINGTTSTTLDPTGSATRAQAATILVRWLLG